MKREIKFRGVGIDGKGWAYGYLLLGKIAVKDELDSEECYSFNDTFSVYDVTPETIGQYTGLKDKNTNDIYEGDILVYGREYSNGEILNPGNFPLIVYYTKNASFELKGKGYGIPDLRADMLRKFEVIGNIHQNPELLTK